MRLSKIVNGLLSYVEVIRSFEICLIVPMTHSPSQGLETISKEGIRSPTASDADSERTGMI
jgi:hypothetical protein